MRSCVSFARTPLASRRSQAFLAVGVPGSRSTPIQSPRWRISATAACDAPRRESKNRAPSTVAFRSSDPSASSSSTSSATAQASGLPPKVLPCCPGLNRPRTSSEPTTAETGTMRAAQRLAEQQQVRFDLLVIAREHAPRAPEPRLDLVGDHEHVRTGTQLPSPAQIAGRRDDHAGLALDRLDEKGHRLVVQRSLERRQVAERDALEPGRVGPEARSRRGIVGEGDDRRRAAVEVLTADDDLRPAGLDPLDLIAPLASRLDRRLDRLGPGVHRQDALHRAGFGEPPAELPEPVVAERAAGQREPLELLLRGRHEPRMAVTEVERRVGGERVEVAASVDVLDPGALAVADDDRERVVVADAVLVLETRRVCDRPHATGSNGDPIAQAALSVLWISW